MPELFKNKMASYCARFSSVNADLSSVKSNATSRADSLALRASMEASMLSCLNSAVAEYTSMRGGIVGVQDQGVADAQQKTWPWFSERAEFWAVSRGCSYKSPISHGQHAGTIDG